MADQKFKVLVADDSAFARRITIASLANSQFDVVGEAKSDKEAVAKFREHAPDVVLLDVIMPEQGGMYALKEIMQINPQAMNTNQPGMPNMKWIMMGMNVFFGFLSKDWPSGLVLYLVVSNCVGLSQQFFLQRSSKKLQLLKEGA